MNSLWTSIQSNKVQASITLYCRQKPRTHREDWFKGTFSENGYIILKMETFKGTLWDLTILLRELYFNVFHMRLNTL